MHQVIIGGKNLLYDYRIVFNIKYRMNKTLALPRYRYYQILSIRFAIPIGQVECSKNLSDKIEIPFPGLASQSCKDRKDGVACYVIQ